MNRPVCIDDYRDLARRRLPRVLFEYVDGGAFREGTLACNRTDFDAVRLTPRVMVDLSRISLKTALFGRDYDLPVVLAPLGLGGLLARRGEVQAARAAARAGAAMCLSTLSVCDVEEACAAAGPLWFQLYMMRDRAYMESLLTRAAAAGCQVLVLTVDLAVPTVRYREMRVGMGGPLGPMDRLARVLDGLTHPAWLSDVYLGGRPLVFGNLASAVPGARDLDAFWGWVRDNFDPSVGWADLEWVRARWKGPIVVKGIMSPDDARAAVDAGADGVVVSNHGGRGLDGAPSSVAALPAVVDAVGGRTTVLMDGGVRSGLEVAKALALGAKACMIGRAWAYPLAARGEAGVAHALDILGRETAAALGLSGCADASQAGPHLLA